MDMNDLSRRNPRSTAIDRSRLAFRFDENLFTWSFLVRAKTVVFNFLAIFLLICAGSIPGALAAETAKVHRTGIGSPNAFIFVAGIEKGFYKDHGLDALTIMAQPQVGVQGLIGGSFDFSQILGASTSAIMRGIGLRIVMVFDSKPQFWLYGAPDIKTLQDVKGKTVAIQTIGGASGHMTRELLSKNGIDPQRDVTIQVIPLEGRLSALSSGGVAATVVNAPERTRANKMGFNELASYGDHFEYSSGGVAVTDKMLAERPDFVRRFLAGTLQTLQWYRANEKEAVKMFARFSKVPEEDALSVYRASVKAYTADGTLSSAAQERILNFHKNEVKIDKDVPAQRIFNFSLLQSILSEKGRGK
jgi:ABC-type nitrate/sulfonate/bicarbonate transport system substrate-binding protein